MKPAVLFVLLILGFVNTADASWVWRDGYWWRNGQAYQAVRVYEHGCYVWKYYPVAQQLPSYQDAKWRDKLTDIVAAKERYEGAAKLSALEHAEWLEAITAIGYPKDSYQLRYADGLSFFKGSYAQQGSSVYGSVIETQKFYNPTNLDVQWNQADRHVEKAQNLAGEALHGFRETLREASEHEATAKERIAAIYAKAELLKAADTPEVTIKKETYFREQSKNRDSRGASNDSGDIIGLIQAKCASCHNASNANGEIDMTKYVGFSPEKKALVQKAITHPDPEKRMPLKKEGDEFVPGEALGFDELLLFR